MKLFTLLSLSLCLLFNINAAGSDLQGINNYYFSAAAGDDSRTAAQATNPATPWKTIDKLNTMMSSLKPGDAVLFNRGEVFNGSIIVTQSGSSTASIIFSAYGIGSKPVINGFATLKTWVSIGNGAWEASLDSYSYLNMVLLNGIVQPMGRFPNSNLPNKGFLTVDTHMGTSQLTDNDLGTATNWTGAEVVIRKNDWTLDRAPITSHSGNTLNFTSPSGHQPTDGYGYFIQNSPLTLDQTGEWYYNPSTKKLRMYFGSENPATYSIKASFVDTLVFIKNQSYLTFDNLSFRGADVAAFQINNSPNVKIQNSEINYTGLDGISADKAPYMTIENNLVNHSNNSGIRLYEGSFYASIKSNNIKNSGTMAGMGSSNNQQHDGIFVESSPSNAIEMNTIDSSGYCGITFTGDSTSVKNNVVTYFCLTVDDGGGIYTWGGWNKVGRKVTNNVILYGIGAPAGTSSSIPGGAVGIYTDDWSTHVDISDNTIAYCARSGIFLHNSHEMNLSGNTLFNNGAQLTMIHDYIATEHPIRNITTTNNIMASSNANQFLMYNESILNDIDSFGSYNNNYYVRPTDQSGIIGTNASDNGRAKTGYYNLEGWTAAYGFDPQSYTSPVKIPTYTVNRLIGGNKYGNGSFNTNADGVICLSSPGHATATYNNGGKLDGGALQVAFDASNGASNDVGVYIDFGAVTTGKTYLVKFSLLGSSASKTIKSFIMQNGGSYTKLSAIKYFNLSTTRTENEFLFTATSTESNAMIALEINGQSCPYWVDNLSITEANVSTINPNDFIRFEYNSTDSTKTINLNNTYVDAANKQYSDEITLAPFSSIILMKTPSSSETTTPTEAATSIASPVQTQPDQTITTTMKVSPNPARENLQVSVSLPENTQTASLTIYSLSGVNIKTIKIPASSSIVPVDISALNNGVYIISINYDGHSIIRKFVKQP